MTIKKTNFKNLYVIDNFKQEDERGYFRKDFNYILYKKLKFNVVENFFTYSKKNVIRANHFQIYDKQSKIITCLKGEIFDVVVDLRPWSKTYKKYFTIILSPKTNNSLYVPYGFSHGYYVIDDAIVSYKTNCKFNDKGDKGFIWNDKTINIKWPNNAKIILSERDKKLPNLNEIEKFFYDWFKKE